MKKTLTVLAALAALTAYSQGEEQVIVIRQNESVKSVKQRRVKTVRTVENFDAFKFDPLRMFIGEINFSWEHRIQERTSFEIELGPTISNLSYTKQGNNHFNDIYYGYVASETQSGMGVLASAAIRYYPLQDYKALNRIYISPRVKYRRYNETYTVEGAGLEDRQGYSSEVIFSFNIGLQEWLSDNFAFDYYIGMGIGSYRERTSNYTVTYNELTGMNDKYIWVDNSRSLARVVGVIGMKVSIGK